MKDLARVEVLKSAIIAASVGSLLSLPHLWLWPARKHPLWYLEALLFLGGTVLWGFVFAWHQKYCGRAPFSFRVAARHWVQATVVGCLTAFLLARFLDPMLRARLPEDYPKTFSQWLTMTLFSLSFTQLFLVYAPFAWLLRLFRNQTVAWVLTIVFGVIVLAVRNRSTALSLTSGLFPALVLVRIGTEGLSLYLYLRGGVLLVCWWVFLVLCRHLFEWERS